MEIKYKKFEFINKTLGNIELIDVFGNEDKIIQCARVSYKCGEGKQKTENEKFIKNLLSLKHETPLEHCSMTFKVKCPIFVARQWIRHRLASTNELSLRYTEVDNPEFYEYDFCNEELNKEQTELHKKLVDIYKNRISNGVKKEIARIDLPVSMLTTFYWTANLREILHFLRLRCHKSAQSEIRSFAIAIKDFADDFFPNVIKYSGIEDLLLQ